MAKITGTDNRDIFETTLEIDNGVQYVTENLITLAVGVIKRGVTLPELLAAVKAESEAWDRALEKQLPIKVALKSPNKDKFIVKRNYGRGTFEVPVDEIIANALDNSYDGDDASDFIELIERIIRISGTGIGRKTERKTAESLDDAIASMPTYIKKYYRKLKGKMNTQDLIAYFGAIDINEQEDDLADPETYDWSTPEGIQEIINDVKLFKTFGEDYEEGLNWALRGWKN